MKLRVMSYEKKKQLQFIGLVTGGYMPEAFPLAN